MGQCRLALGSPGFALGLSGLALGLPGLLDPNMLVLATRKSPVWVYCPTRSPSAVEYRLKGSRLISSHIHCSYYVGSSSLS